jgi:hypothetical protein
MDDFRVTNQQRRRQKEEVCFKRKRKKTIALSKKYISIWFAFIELIDS